MPSLNAPVVAKSFDNRFELFIPWTNGKIYHKWQTIASSATNPAGEWIQNWHPHGTKGTGFRGPLGLIANEDERLELFAGTKDGRVYHKWQSFKGGPWGDWVPFVEADSFAVGSNSDGRLEVLFVAPFGDFFGHKWQISKNNGWSDRFQFPPPPDKTEITFFDTPAVARNGNAKLEVFVTGIYENKTRLFHFRQTTTGPNATWSTYNIFNASSGLTATRPVVASSADGRLELFALGNQEILHAWQTPSGGWSNWFSHGKPVQHQNVDNPAPLAAHDEGRLALRVVSVSEDPIASQVFGKKQVVASGAWTNWFVDSPQGVFSDPAMVQSVDKRLYLFVVGYPKFHVFYKWEKTPNGEWSVPPESLAWPDLGRPG